ncbi:uncharacterized protein G2W53_003573 [Senna tora]|uniref:Uncharacterized protein n=1 Tax=Senna tora TaxID=362788 RepID=A0A835CIJ4_9FABA|nr:uncharacterized protein G2W53_003573 [Senna tora]
MVPSVCTFVPEKFTSVPLKGWSIALTSFRRCHPLGRSIRHSFFSEEVFLQLPALACFPWYLQDMRDNIGDNLDNRVVPVCRLVGVDYYGFYWKNGSALNPPYGGPALCTH